MSKEDISNIISSAASLRAEAERMEKLGLRLELLRLAEGENNFSFNLSDEARANNSVVANDFSEDFRLYPSVISMDVAKNTVTVSGIDENGEEYSDISIDELVYGDCGTLYDAIQTTLDNEEENS